MGIALSAPQRVGMLPSVSYYWCMLLCVVKRQRIGGGVPVFWSPTCPIVSLLHA